MNTKEWILKGPKATVKWRLNNGPINYKCINYSCFTATVHFTNLAADKENEECYCSP